MPGLLELFLNILAHLNSLYSLFFIKLFLYHGACLLKIDKKTSTGGWGRDVKSFKNKHRKSNNKSSNFSWQLGLKGKPEGFLFALSQYIKIQLRDNAGHVPRESILI